MNLVLRQAMRPVLVGGLVGVAGCAAVSWVLSSMLFGLSAHDPMAFVIVPSLLLILALVASYLPARRSEEHTSELQSRLHLVCRLLLEKKNNNNNRTSMSG